MLRVNINHSVNRHRYNGNIKMKFSKEIIANGDQSTDQLYPGLITLDEVANNLRVSRRYVQSLVRRKVIPVIRLGRRCTRFDLARVHTAIKRFEIIEMGRK